MMAPDVPCCPICDTPFRFGSSTEFFYHAMGGEASNHCCGKVHTFRHGVVVRTTDSRKKQ